MLEIFLFALAMMYSPGPVNMLSLFAGVSDYGWRALRFCAGVGVAMCLLFIVTGYLGSSFMTEALQGVAALAGGSYIAYLALKIIKASFQVQKANNTPQNLTFVAGFLMQLTNPKAMVAVLPIVTVQFPNAHVEGAMILLMSMMLGAMAGGAPASYFVAGNRLKQAVLNPTIMSWLQRVMGVMLLFLAVEFLISGLSMLAQGDNLLSKLAVKV
ncbi:cysteine/O-acetylserine exporter [Marinomonas aquimarina]|uniref:Cysteine/O-acetylserine exporter n=1 Tax=Marinomonas aquimarina TaxID=295068 RepID=A0A1A8TM70_9GAMM|nr:LysE family transporter [Marinomonas aquimarina]SBS34787.1 cysteine/O-acetylserine exporter [Marinomonas aquimarina]